jgi:hypothetical protein
MSLEKSGRAYYCFWKNELLKNLIYEFLYIHIAKRKEWKVLCW